MEKPTAMSSSHPVLPFEVGSGGQGLQGHIILLIEHTAPKFHCCTNTHIHTTHSTVLRRDPGWRIKVVTEKNGSASVSFKIAWHHLVSRSEEACHPTLQWVCALCTAHCSTLMERPLYHLWTGFMQLDWQATRPSCHWWSHTELHHSKRVEPGCCIRDRRAPKENRNKKKKRKKEKEGQELALYVTRHLLYTLQLGWQRIPKYSWMHHAVDKGLVAGKRYRWISSAYQ